jgi:hypothetical protein
LMPEFESVAKALSLINESLLHPYSPNNEPNAIFLSVLHLVN